MEKIKRNTVKIYEKESLKTKEEKSHLYGPAPAFDTEFPWVTLDLHWLIQSSNYLSEEA